ncbi:MAG: 16S rRNA (guanine(527)-N(7))-methyltransferase RsmG [Phycisphaerae bacterium]|nr:16S rRNA (guanine(527)-N(7))-methyltransferase RsmG [Phycisphaerae bacterium]|tara:strand:- start:1862 stop:2581 length:720 start_codon:yes stop_codon:yes gene_type:complete
MFDIPDSFHEQLAQLQLELDAPELEQLHSYLRLLYEANQRMNLTAVRDAEEAWNRHLLDSLSLLPVLQSVGAGRVLDLGSGGGLPGLPLAITMPDVQFMLLEATGKKAKFLEETAAELGLANVEVLDERAETIGEPGCVHRAGWDVVTARAVGPMNVLLELAMPLVVEGGLLLAIKGERAPIELKEADEALRVLKSRVVETRRTTTGTIVVVEKVDRTPADYPRRPGEPKRLPIGTKQG